MERERGSWIKPIYIGGTVNIGLSIIGLLFTAVGFWLLDIIGIDVWIASRIAHFISLVVERV